VNFAGLQKTPQFFVHDDPDGMNAADTNRITDLIKQAAAAHRVFQECGAVTL
jgi:hypothetical protein